MSELKFVWWGAQWWTGDGRVYFLDGHSNCVVVKAGPEYEELARNDLDESTVSSPAIAGGKIFIRTKERLYAIGTR